MGAVAAHNWAVLLLSLGFLWEKGRRWRKTQAWPWRQRDTICCTYLELMPSLLPYQWTPSLSLPPALVICFLWLIVVHIDTVNPNVEMCQVRAGIIPAPWRVIKHIWSISAFPDPPSRPRDMCLLSIAGPHLPPAPFLKWICHTSEARKLPGWVPPPFELNGLNTIRREVSKIGPIWIACEQLHHVLLLVFSDRKTSPQATISFFSPLRKCYSGDSSFTPETIGSVNHPFCVRHVPLSCLLAKGALQQINSPRTMSQFFVTGTFSPSLKFKHCNIYTSQKRNSSSINTEIVHRSLDGGEAGGGEFDAKGIPAEITICLSWPFTV